MKKAIVSQTFLTNLHISSDNPALHPQKSIKLISQTHQEGTLYPTDTFPVQDFSVSTHAVWHNFIALEWMPFSITKPRDNSCDTPRAALPSFGTPGLRSSSVSACSSESLLIQAGYLCLLLMSKTQDSGLYFENYIIQAAELQANYAILHPKRLNTSS